MISLAMIRVRLREMKPTCLTWWRHD